MMALALVAFRHSPLPCQREKEKEHEGKNVDSGSFGVFQSGHRVGTETFSIYQTSNGSVIQSEFKTENAPTHATCKLPKCSLPAPGEIRRYEWKELSPEKAQSVVLPNDDFLTQKWTTGPQEKEHEQPYLLPASTSILDDYFFIHREVLAWKFLAAACKQEKGQVQCPPKQRAQFGTLNPHQHSSAALSAEFLGREKVTLKSGPAGPAQNGIEERRGNVATLARRSIQGNADVHCGREYRSGPRLAWRTTAQRC